MVNRGQFKGADVTIMPPGTGLSYERMLDALVGGLIGVLVMALLPRNPIPESRRVVATVLDMGADVLYDVARGLENRDAERIAAALQVARSTQRDVTQMDSIIADGVEQVQVSPLMWHRRRHLRSLARVAPGDNAVRNVRVLARRAIIAMQDSAVPSPEVIDLVKGCGQSMRTVRRLLDDAPSLAEIPEWGELPHDDTKTGAFRVVEDDGPVTAEVAIRDLRILAAHMRPALLDGATLSEMVIFAQCRSLVVDMRCAAVAEIRGGRSPPTTDRLGVPPRWTNEDD